MSNNKLPTAASVPENNRKFMANLSSYIVLTTELYTDRNTIKEERMVRQTTRMSRIILNFSSSKTTSNNPIAGLIKSIFVRLPPSGTIRIGRIVTYISSKEIRIACINPLLCRFRSFVFSMPVNVIKIVGA